MEDLQEKTIGEMVAEDYRTAAVFKKYEIDFCCNGNRSLEQACNNNIVSINAVKNDLRLVMESSGNKENVVNDFASWPLDLLVSYIEKKHHRYVTKQIPVLKAYLDKLCKVHGEKHPEVLEINSLFSSCAAELSSHMKKEEQVLFPYIMSMVAVKEEIAPSFSASFGSVQNPISMMMQEHETEGQRFRKIKELSGNYMPPPDACNTYRVTYALLQEFEDDLHLHIHLENNILFPRSVEMEATLA